MGTPCAVPKPLLLPKLHRYSGFERAQSRAQVSLDLHRIFRLWLSSDLVILGSQFFYFYHECQFFGGLQRDISHLRVPLKPEVW